MHDRSDRVPRTKKGLRQTEYRDPRLQRGFRRVPGKIQGQAKIEFSPAERSGLRGYRSIWRAANEKFSGEILSRNRAQHGACRSGWKSGKNLAQREVERPRRRGGRSVKSPSIVASPASRCRA